MSRYLIRRDGLEFPVSGLSALERLVWDGDLRPNDPVFDPEVSAWRPARAIPPLAQAFEERTARVDAIRRESAAEQEAPEPGGPEEIAVEEPEVVEPQGLEPTASEPEASEPATSKPEELEPDEAEGRSEDLPEFDLSDLAFQSQEEGKDSAATVTPAAADTTTESPPSTEEESTTDATEKEDDNVIAFPHDLMSGRPSRGGAVLAELASFPPPEFDEPLSRAALPLPTAERKPPPRIRTAVVLMAVLFGGLSLLLIRYNVRVMSQMTFDPVDGVGRVVAPTSVESTSSSQTPDAEKSGTAAVVEALAVGPGTVAPDELSPYEAIEDALRLRLHAGIVPVEGNDGLEGSLLIELSRLKIEVVKVDAPVLQWGGRNQDMPQVAEIVILFRSQVGELDRELAAVGLVVGKYVQHYNLDVPSIRAVVDDGQGGGKGRLIDSERARRFYLQRISLYEYLLGSSTSD